MYLKYIDVEKLNDLSLPRGLWPPGNINITELYSHYLLLYPSSEEVDFAYFNSWLFEEDWVDSPRSIGDFVELVHKWLNENNINIFRCSPIWRAFSMMLKEGYHNYQGWKDIIRHLIGVGANVVSTISHWTMLNSIIDLGETIFESSDLGTRWLDILSYSIVDVDEYLRKEGLGLPNRSKFLPSFERWNGAMKIQVLEEGGHLSCDWFVEPDAEALAAIHEFGYFGPKVDHTYD